jgi:hypothetical protein
MSAGLPGSRDEARLPGCRDHRIGLFSSADLCLQAKVGNGADRIRGAYTARAVMVHSQRRECYRRRALHNPASVTLDLDWPAMLNGVCERRTIVCSNRQKLHQCHWLSTRE